MSHKLLALGVLAAGALCAAPVTITITLSGGTFDRGVTSGPLDTGSGFTTSLASCTGAGCASLSNLTSLNTLLLSFTGPSGSTTGIGSTVSGSLTQPQDIAGFALTGQTAFSQNASIAENISATGVLGDPGALTGSLALSWNGNSSVQARAATGTITLAGNVASSPEPSTVLLLSLSIPVLLAFRKLRPFARN
jgi:hypothetical protein